MRSVGLIVMLLCGWLSSAPGDPLPQENLHAQVFEDADTIRAQAMTASADIYAPRNWKQASASYNQADALFKQGTPMYEVKEKLRASITYLRIALQVCKQFSSTFGTVITARADALSSHAEKYSNELWQNGEERLRAAAAQLEDGNLSASRTAAGEALSLYRAAELDAIKSTTLAHARDLLKRADLMDVKKNAPVTLARAKSLYARAAALIQENRYDNAQARSLAEQASYEASHAIYIHQYIQQLKKQDKGLEHAILESEDEVRHVMDALGLYAEFDAGFDAPVHEILQELRKNEAERGRLRDTIKLQATTISALKRRVALLKSDLPSASSVDDEDLVKEAVEMKQFDATYTRVSSKFTSNDASVARDGNNLILRLYGVTFGTGNTITTQSYPLLGRVVEAVRQFPGCQVSVEGHTEAGGSEIANQITTEARAEAVAQYLKANLPPNIPVLSHGYGSTRPLTVNSSPEGKALNRRIEVVIVPEWAIVGK
jgi:OOP family OmpA-OmpF porin